MKTLSFILFLSLCLHSSAQDTVQKLNISTLSNKTVYTAKPKSLPLTVEQQLIQKVNRFLDSMVQTNDAHPFFIGKVKAGISNILYQFWKNRSLAGTKPEEAFFVQCNSQTMTQKDIADGRLVVVIGYARIKPAEFSTERFERILLNKTPLQYANQF
jgi:phage tail sheath protein FI